MELTRVGTYYPVAAERFVAVAWTISTPRSEILALSPDIAIVRVRDDGALVTTFKGEQRVVPDGSVLRLNRTTGALAIQTQAEFESAFRLAQ